MPINKELKSLIEKVKSEFNLKQEQIAERIKVSPTYLSGMINGSYDYTESIKEKIKAEFRLEEVTENLTNVKIKGDQTNQLNISGIIHYILLLPLSAIGGTLNDFVMSIKEYQCERIISPIKEADFALTVSGHSMFPEYPAGSQILIKRIDASHFIEWGRTYVLDTVNGVVIKNIIKGEEGFYRCVSVNPDQVKYAPFDVPMESVYAVYRVLMSMSMK